MPVAVRPRYNLLLRSRDWPLGHRTLVMGILNVTPNSFSDGGRFLKPSSAEEQARRLIDQGADILDIGGESTRPFSEAVDRETELQRALPLIEAVRAISDIPISIDTTKSEVARRALEVGADIINDVSALRFDERMAAVAAESGAPLILMHMLGTPETMQQAPSYASLFSQIITFLEERIRFAVECGVSRDQIIVDPGIGFGKTVNHNLSLIRHLEAFHCLERPLLLGASRKRFIGTVLDKSVDDREVGSAVVHSFAVAAGAHILRVHDAAFHRQAALMADAVRDGVEEKV